MLISHADPAHKGAEDLNTLLKIQKAACLAEPMPDHRIRIRRLDILHNALLDHRKGLITAVSEDFSHRAPAETELAEIMPLLEGIAYYRKRLKRLMRPQKTPYITDVKAGLCSGILPAFGGCWYCGAVEFPHFPCFVSSDRCFGCREQGHAENVRICSGDRGAVATDFF